MQCNNCGSELTHLEHGAYKTCNDCGTKTKKPALK